ncbi:MAG TPA: OsmC family protein [Ignavibacteria bacterium]
MTTAETIYKGELRTIAKHIRSGIEIITDAPVDNHGKGEAFSPTDLVATALGSCMLTIMGLAAKTHNFNIDGTRLEITKVMAENPRRISEVVIDFTFPHKNYTKKEKQIIEHSARTCPVSQSLHTDLKQTLNFNF